jgi:membrane protein
MRLAASLALYTLLALAPLMVIAVKVGAVLLGQERAAQIVENQTNKAVGGSGAPAIHQMIVHATQPKSGIVAAAISLVIVLFSASGAIRELRDSLNTIWDVKIKSGLGWWYAIKSRVVPMVLVLFVAVLMLASVVLSALIIGFSKYMGPIAKPASFVVDIVVSIGVLSALFALLFKYIPRAKIAWRDALIGGALSAVLFVIGKYVLSLYFKYGSPTSAYGALGSIVAVLLWVYYSAQILFFGAEFTQVHARRHGRPLKPAYDAVTDVEQERTVVREVPPGGRLAELERMRQEAHVHHPR